MSIPSRNRLSREDRLRRDHDLMQKFNIHHEPQVTSAAWPAHLKNTFQSIERLGSFRYEVYGRDFSPDKRRDSWKQEIKSRAKELSDTAVRLLNENPSELTWRLELEALVYWRFSRITEW